MLVEDGIWEWSHPKPEPDPVLDWLDEISAKQAGQIDLT